MKQLPASLLFSITLFFFCWSSAIAQKEQGFQLFSGLRSDNFFINVVPFINDSTEVELGINEDIGLSFGGLYHRAVGQKLHVYTLIAGYSVYESSHIIVYKTFNTNHGPERVPNSVGIGSYFLVLENMNGLRYNLNRYFSVSAGLGITYKITTEENGYNTVDYVEVANAVRDIFKKLNPQLGVGVTFQIKKIFLTLRYQRSAFTDTKNIVYRERQFPVGGPLHSFALDIGYDLSW